MLNCIIIDDELPAITVIANFVKKIPFLNLATTTTDALDGITIINKQKIDLIFLDIQMPTLTGLDFIKAINGKSKVIIISAYSQYALDGFELEVIDYLLKPVSFPRFLKAVQKAKDMLDNTLPISASTSDFIMLKADGKGKLVKVELENIDYIESFGNYIIVYTEGKKITSHLSLKELEDKLPQQKFIRVHKSFIIPIAKITAVESSNIFLKNNSTPIPLGSAYKDSFLEIMTKR